MRYYEWHDGPSMPFADFAVCKIFTEVDEHGQVKREIGFNSSGLVVYRCPDKRETRRPYKRGFFDLAPVDITAPNDLTADEFEIQWKLADSHLG